MKKVTVESTELTQAEAKKMKKELNEYLKTFNGKVCKSKQRWCVHPQFTSTAKEINESTISITGKTHNDLKITYFDFGGGWNPIDIEIRNKIEDTVYNTIVFQEDEELMGDYNYVLKCLKKYIDEMV